MKKIIFIINLLVLTSSIINAQKKILVVTGGHDFEEKEFYEMFNSFNNVDYDKVIQPAANELINSPKINEYEAIVFYDMYQEITGAQKNAYLNVLASGKGMVFLHHSLVSYQFWPEFQNIIGGKYVLEKSGNNPKSTYKHDVDILVQILDRNHPITKDLNDFNIHDEVYGSYIVNNDVIPLLKTDHPESTKTIAWHHQYKNSRIVYLQSGHDHHAYENINFRQLLLKAINWASSTN